MLLFLIWNLHLALPNLPWPQGSSSNPVNATLKLLESLRLFNFLSSPLLFSLCSLHYALDAQCRAELTCNLPVDSTALERSKFLNPRDKADTFANDLLSLPDPQLLNSGTSCLLKWHFSIRCLSTGLYCVHPDTRTSERPGTQQIPSMCCSFKEPQGRPRVNCTSSLAGR